MIKGAIIPRQSSEAFFEDIMDTLREKLRIAPGREESPSVGIIDLRSAKTSQHVDKILADGGYRGDGQKEMVRKKLGCQLEVVLRPDESPKKFNVLPLRWIVERSFAWLYNFRRVALDYGFYSESSEAMIQIAFSKIMLNKLSN